MSPAAAAVRDELENLPDGWFHHGQRILELLDAARPLSVVELGTWLGASAIGMARLVRRWGGTVTCVDTWGGDLDATGGAPPNRQPVMLWSCARAMVAAGVGATVRLIPALTSEAAHYWHEPIDCLYVDADHSYAGTLADLDAWMPHVRPGGLVMGDDYGSSLYPGVKQAWDEFEAAHGLTLTRYQSDPPAVNGIQLIYGYLS